MKRFNSKRTAVYALVITGLLFLTAGCGKKVAASGTANTPDQTATLDSLTQALRQYLLQHRTFPKSFADVVAAGYVKDMPIAPIGKRFEIEQKTARVTLVDQ
jgi:hypothetical protein